MLDLILNKVLPTNLMFLLGYLLKKTNLLDEDDGKTFLKGMFYIFLPAALFQSISKVQFKSELMAYPLVMITFQLFMFFLGKLIVNKMNISPDQKIIARGSLIILNGSFVLPFYISFNGMENLWRMGLYDFGNMMIIVILIYSMFLKIKFKDSIKSLRTPAVFAIISGILISKTGTQLPPFFDTFLKPIAGFTGPSIMLGLGLYFTPKFENIKVTSLIVGSKIAVGILAGLLLMNILPFDPLSKKTILYLTTAPIGANILTFTVLSGMDTKFAAEIVSLSIIINLFLTPLIFILI